MSQERKKSRDENLTGKINVQVYLARVRGMRVPHTQHPGSLQKPEANVQTQNSPREAVLLLKAWTPTRSQG